MINIPETLQADRDKFAVDPFGYSALACPLATDPASAWARTRMPLLHLPNKCQPLYTEPIEVLGFLITDNLEILGQQRSQLRGKRAEI